MLTNMQLVRVLIGTAGLFVALVGTMYIVMPWWFESTRPTGYVITGVGVVMWLQAIPVLKAAERAEMKQLFLDELNKKK
ncbi:hypothetical protein XI03_11185 [Bradyrhizobium sp. CCBAU 65884]|uniref:hypothetical protein n=1 Tax=Bradyrhizobium sp. CCBAU 65884 TaxID=722477 RepID=UPI0023052342|nr:hypothetical protein [Bradyrhizobium sp. CCBAU 65884]MDA9475052.1 hypothetical protein [Bradyrhizobium sp. CCBAU 65884]